MGTDLSKQFTRQPRAILIAASALMLFGLVPGMPTMTFVVLGLAVGGVGFLAKESIRKRAAQKTEEEEAAKAQQAPPEEKPEDLLRVDTIGLELGYGLIPLVDANQGGDLLDRIGSIRKQLASELGIIVPSIRIRDNVRLKPSEYQIKIKGIRVAGSELMLDQLMAINPGFVEEEIEGFATKDPAFGLDARWIIPALKEVAEAKDYTVVEPSAVLATHLTEVIRTAAPEILTRQDVQNLADNLKHDFPALVNSVIPELLPLGTLHKVLQALLAERVPIRDLATIVETASDYASATKEPDVLAEYVRMALKRQITEMNKDDAGKVNVFTIDPALEQQMADSVQNTKQGLMLVIDPQLTEQLLEKIGKEVQKMQSAGLTPACICSPNVRLALRRLVEASYPNLVLLSYNEITPDVELVSTGMVRTQDGD
jgi:flagellar biosynthesis protein FlhA